MSARIAATLIAGAMLVTGACALAQSPAADSAPAMTCQQMMDQEKPLVAQMTDTTKMAMAQKQMSMAQTDLDAGKMHRCEVHMKKVMKMTN